MRIYLEKFLSYLEFEKGYSKNTIKGYEENIEYFFQFLEDKKYTDIKKINYNVIRQFLTELYHHHYSKRTVARYISSLRSFFKFLNNEEIIEENPMILISNPKLDKRLPSVLNYEQVEEIIKKPNQETPLGIRDACMFELLYSTGIRVSELVGIKLSDLYLNRHQIKILGKGNKERYVLFGTPCLELLNQYLKVRLELLKNKNHEFLFLDAHGNPLTTNGVRYRLKQYVRTCDFKTKVSPHMFRHTFATDMLNEGADLKTVQELLGHENLSTTQVYTHVSNERLRRVYLESHPRAKK